MRRAILCLVLQAATIALGAQERIHGISPKLLKSAQQRIQQAAISSGTVTSANIVNTSGDAVIHGLPTKGKVRILVMPIEFPDCLHDSENTESYIYQKLFGAGVGLQPKSMRDWYLKSSYGQLDVTGEVLPWFQIDKPRAEVPHRIDSMVEQALQYYVWMGGIDFTQYDNDGDGRFDLIFVVYAGEAVARGDFWWSYKGDFSDRDYLTSAAGGDHSTDPNVGWGLDSFIWTAEGVGIGTWFHEFGHALGLPDLYDGDATAGPSGGVGGWDLMDSDSKDLNCFSKFLLDWITPKMCWQTTKGISLKRAEDPNVATDEKAVVMAHIISNPDPFLGDFFMIEHRGRTPWQDGNDSGLPGDGLLVWHVDSTLNASKTGFLFDNSSTPHKLLRLMEADGLEEIEAANPGKNPTIGTANFGDMYEHGNIFGVDTLPNSSRYDGSPTWMGLSNIRYPSGDAADGITFDVYYDDSEPVGEGAVPQGSANATTGIGTFTFSPGMVSDPESGIGGYHYQLSIIGPGKQIFRDGFTTLNTVTVAAQPTDMTEQYRDLYVGSAPVFARTRVLNGAGIQSGDWSEWSAPIVAAWPTIQGISPSSATQGTTIVISGRTLGAVQTVKFFKQDEHGSPVGVEVTNFVVDATGKTLTVAVPAGAQTGVIMLICPGFPDLVTPIPLEVLTVLKVIRFDNAAAWTVNSVNAGSASISETSEGTLLVQFLDAAEYVQIKSQPLSSLPRANPEEFTIAVKPSADVPWGGIGLILDSLTSTPNLNTRYVSYAEIRGFKAGQWQNVTWALPDDLVQILQGGFSDLKLTYAISLPKGSRIELDGPH